MCNIKVASDKELNLDYMDAGAGIRFFQQLTADLNVGKECFFD